MKLTIVRHIAALIIALAAFSQPAEAGPVTFVVNRAAHFVHKAASKIDNHVIEPTRRAVVNHTPRPRRVVHRI